MTGSDTAPHAPDDRDTSTKIATGVFIAVVIGAVPLLLYRGRDQWFALDEWDFLALRQAGSFADLMRPHNEHLSTLPILYWRAMFAAVGLNHYWPYQLAVIAMHLVTAALLRVVMLRAGANVWIATAAASLFVVFGASRGTMAFAFQVVFTGALALGLGHLLLADHDGPIQRRDVLGLACGLGALLTSGVGIVMVAVVGIATLLRRGWRVAAFHTVPLAVVFVVWFVAYGDRASRDNDVGKSIEFFRIALFNGFQKIGWIEGMGWILVATLLTGVVIVVLRTPAAEIRRRYPSVIALTLGAVLFTMFTAYSRVTTVFGEDPRTGRYVYPIAALLLPALAVAASQLATLWRPLLAVGIALFLVGMPGNFAALEPEAEDRFAFGRKDLVLSLAQVPDADAVPGDLVPIPFLLDGVTMDWLRDARRAGKLPDPGSVSPDIEAEAVLFTHLRQVAYEDGAACRGVADSTPVRLEVGDLVPLAVRPLVVGNWEDGAAAGSRTAAGAGTALRTETGPVDVVLSRPGTELQVCASP